VDVAAGAADGGPGAAEAAGPLREVGVLGDAALHDALDGVLDVVEVAAGELAVEGAGVEERRRGAAESAALVEVVERLGLGLALVLVEEEAHGDAHPEELRRLDAALLLGVGLVDDEVAVVERLDSEVVELQVGRGVEGARELGEVVLLEARIESADEDAVADVFLELLAVELLEGADAVADD